MAGIHKTTSPYLNTPIKDFYLDVMTKRSIPASSNDELVTIEAKYNERPDLFANDYFGSPRLWWVLATRNMLRSRKKQLEQPSKKSEGAATRQISEIEQARLDDKAKKQANVPAIETVPENPFTPEVIDPSKVKLANQVDKWANMIDAMVLNGRLRQLAIHATIDEGSTEGALILKLDQATKHLRTENAQQQLEHAISEHLKRQVTVEIITVEKTVADPFQIQSHINDKRYDYAKKLLLEDEIVVKFKEDFQAEVDESSIVAL